jgi:hypothetical protein
VGKGEERTGAGLSLIALPPTFASEVKHLLMWLACGLLLGLASGYLGAFIDYQESSANPVDHWYDVAELLAIPGFGFGSLLLGGPYDDYTGSIWDNRGLVVIANGISWTLISLFVFSVRSLVRAMVTDLKSYQRPHAR